MWENGMKIAHWFLNFCLEYQAGRGDGGSCDIGFFLWVPMKIQLACQLSDIAGSKEEQISLEPYATKTVPAPVHMSHVAVI